MINVQEHANEPGLTLGKYYKYHFNVFLQIHQRQGLRLRVGLRLRLRPGGSLPQRRGRRRRRRPAASAAAAALRV